MSAPNRRQLLTGAAAYAAGAAIVAGGAALASEAHGATIAHDPALARLIATAWLHNERVDRHEREVVERAPTREARRAACLANNELSDAWADALDEVAHYPVRTAADLNTKLAFMRENQMGDGRDWLDTISQDVARIVEARA